jgi:hypothetical protein
MEREIMTYLNSRNIHMVKPSDRADEYFHQNNLRRLTLNRARKSQQSSLLARRRRTNKRKLKPLALSLKMQSMGKIVKLVEEEG